MTLMSLRNEIIAFIRMHAGNETLVVDSSANFIQTGYLDSAAMMDLLLMLEDDHDIYVDLLEHDPATLMTLDGLMTVIGEKV